jgi:hypothetical protein
VQRAPGGGRRRRGRDHRYRGRKGGLLRRPEGLPRRPSPERPARKGVSPLAVGGSLAVLAIDYALRLVLASLGATQVTSGLSFLDQQLGGADSEDLSIEPDLQARLGVLLTGFAQILQQQAGFFPGQSPRPPAVNPACLSLTASTRQGDREAAAPKKSRRQLDEPDRLPRVLYGNRCSPRAAGGADSIAMIAVTSSSLERGPAPAWGSGRECSRACRCRWRCRRSSRPGGHRGGTRRRHWPRSPVPARARRRS